MQAGARHYHLSQLGEAQRRAAERPRDAAGRFLAVDGRALVKDVASLKSGAADLVRSVGHLTVSELRDLFGGKSVTAIRKMGPAARASVLGAQLVDAGALAKLNASQLGAAVGFWATSAHGVGGDPKTAYDDPGVAPFLAEAGGHVAAARRARIGGEGEQAARALGQAIEIYDVILSSYPQNPDALVGKAQALYERGLARVDIRAPKNESANVKRHAREDLAEASKLYGAVVKRAEQEGLYLPAKNQLTAGNLNKLIGNDELRNLPSALAEALYGAAVTRIATARLEGRPVYDRETLAAIDRASHVGTNLGDGPIAAQLLRASAYNGGDAIAKAHNAKLATTLREMAAFGAEMGPSLARRFAGDPDLRAQASHSKSGRPALDGDLRRDPAFQNAISMATA